MTAVGPLTTTFQAPSSCSSTTPQIFQVWSGSVSSYVEGPLFTSGSDCFPSGYDPAPTHYFSPGWCPHGYTSACSSRASASTKTETAVICCPTHFSYTCPGPTAPNQPSLGCTTTWKDALAVLGVTVVTDGATHTTKTLVTETANGITAYGIQVRFRAGDPTPAPATQEPGFTVINRTSAPPVSIPTDLLVPAPPPPSSPSGVSTPVAIGIGVGSAVAALVVAGVIGLFFFLRWRRKKRPRQVPSSTPPPVPPKELPGSPVPYRAVPPPYELAEDASPRRQSASFSKRHLSMSPAPGWTPTRRGCRGDSGVLGAGHEAVELEAPSEASLRDRASPQSESSAWTDRQTRGATMPMPWL